MLDADGTFDAPLVSRTIATSCIRANTTRFLPEVPAQGAHAADRPPEVIGEVCVRCEVGANRDGRNARPVHLLLDGDPQFGINRLVRSIKGRSSHVLRNGIPSLEIPPAELVDEFIFAGHGR
jgi:hypothetical protein